MPLSVRQRRAHWAAVEAGDAQGWVCDRCGSNAEETLIVWNNGRVTRRGTTVVCLCDRCEDITPHGPMEDQ